MNQLFNQSVQSFEEYNRNPLFHHTFDQQCREIQEAIPKEIEAAAENEANATREKTIQIQEKLAQRDSLRLPQGRADGSMVTTESPLNRPPAVRLPRRSIGQQFSCDMTPPPNDRTALVVVTPPPMDEDFEVWRSRSHWFESRSKEVFNKTFPENQNPGNSYF